MVDLDGVDHGARVAGVEEALAVLAALAVLISNILLGGFTVFFRFMDSECADMDFNDPTMGLLILLDYVTQLYNYR